MQATTLANVSCRVIFFMVPLEVGRERAAREAGKAPGKRQGRRTNLDGKGDYMITMLGARLLCAVLFFTLTAGAAMAGGATGGGAFDGPGEPAVTPSTPPARAVGVTLSPGPGGEAQAYRVFFEAGATAIEAPQPWSTLEPSPRRFRLRDVAAIVQGVRSTAAMRIMAIPAAVETTSRSVPPDLEATAWDSPRMIARYRGMLRRLALHLSHQVRYLSIANEADVYFSAHPDELPAFRRFARAAIAELHRRAPWVKVGVTVTYGGLTAARPAIARSLAALGDATILTYYPLAGGYRMRPPSAPRHDVPRIVRLAHGRPLVVQEAGYATARRLGGSPAAQARFVRNVFASADRFPGAVTFLSFYSLFDLPARDCRGRSPEVAFLCSLGLHYRNGRPKPAWAAFRAEAREARP
jgi:hypothetical protein